MNWIFLILAGFCETGFAFCLGKGNIETGHKATLWYIAFIVALVLSMVLLAKATKTIPLSIAYPVWTGIGAVGTVIVGMLIFKEPASFWKLFFICTLIGSVIGLKLVH
jgi:quaternary ammonium compound-resistance protein SugE